MSQQFSRKTSNENDQLMSCPLCHEKYTPTGPRTRKVLSCLHGYCINCISSLTFQYLQNKNQSTLATAMAKQQQLIRIPNDQLLSSDRFPPTNSSSVTIMRSVTTVEEPIQIQKAQGVDIAIVADISSSMSG